jgi:plasmid maintenance system killer protein
LSINQYSGAPLLVAEGFWAVSVSGNWRIVFRFEGGDTYDVDLLDYHSEVA